MSTPIHDQFKAMLVELAEAGMEVSREMMIGVRKSVKQDERIAYGQAHDRAARSVRLTISLYERLERAEREAALDVQAVDPRLTALERRLQPEVELRKAQVRAAVRRTIEQDHEGEDAQLLETALEAVLTEHALEWSFMKRPANEAVDFIRRALKLRGGVRFRLPDAIPPSERPSAERPPSKRPTPS